MPQAELSTRKRIFLVWISCIHSRFSEQIHEPVCIPSIAADVFHNGDSALNSSLAKILFITMTITASLSKMGAGSWECIHLIPPSCSIKKSNRQATYHHCKKGGSNQFKTQKANMGAPPRGQSVIDSTITIRWIQLVQHSKGLHGLPHPGPGDKSVIDSTITIDSVCHRKKSEKHEHLKNNH